MTAVMKLEKVVRTYVMGDQTLRALDEVDFEANAGDLLAVMGTSGSGKSTLMNVLGCLDRPTKGRYLLAGEEVSSMSRDQLARVRNKTIGFVFQSFNLLSRTSAIENVELPLLYGGVPTAERHRRAKEALEQVGLGQRLDHKPNQLSGGQQQRVAIARAIVGRPKVVLADEPTGNLDSRTSIEVMAMFQRLWREGMTVLLVTHEPDIAAYASRVITMRDGKIRSDVKQEPRVADVEEAA
ncbi:MAG: ABC transporter ATP-binding protein [Myxococcaceae bacterium]|nr:ABC transporter ATP-binding protein [Myxococcaceae bacterium]